MKAAISVLIGLVLGIGCTALWASGVLWWPLEHRVLINTDKASLDQELQNYKDRLEFFGKRADDLERLLTLLLAGSTIYALAVAYNGYQQAKDAKEKLDGLKTEAQTEVNKLKTDTTDEINKLKIGWANEISGLTSQFTKEVASLRTNASSQMDQISVQVAGKTKLMEEQFNELRTSAEAQVKRIEEQIARKFPLFKDMDFAINTTTGKILHLLPLLDLVEGKYASLKPQEKQQILFYEKAMAVFECFDTHSLKEDIATIYRGLGTFYALKYKHEIEMAKSLATEAENQSSGPAHESRPTPAQVRNRNFEEEIAETRERALFYLNYALQQDRKNVAALNDRAHFALIVEPLDYERATNLLEESKKIDSEQQRAFYNLAWIKHKEKEYHNSLELVKEALKRKRWQEKVVPERICDIHYHRACCSGCIAKTEKGDARKALLDSALEDLEIVAQAKIASWKKLLEALEDDLNKAEGQATEGDLVALLEDPNMSARVNAVREIITRKAAESRD